MNPMRDRAAAVAAQLQESARLRALGLDQATGIDAGQVRYGIFVLRRLIAGGDRDAAIAVFDVSELRRSWLPDDLRVALGLEVLH